VLRTVSSRAYAFYAWADGALKNPIARVIMGLRAGRRARDSLERFVMPAMRWYRRWYDEGSGDELRRDAPAIMLFHTGVSTVCGNEDCFSAAWHAVLMAETLGVGTCINGLLVPAANRSPELRHLLALPEGREVHAALTLGYPRHGYHRVITRRPVEVRWVECPDAEGAGPSGAAPEGPEAGPAG
jgi:nitroreductase